MHSARSASADASASDLAQLLLPDKPLWGHLKGFPWWPCKAPTRTLTLPTQTVLDESLLSQDVLGARPFKSTKHLPVVFFGTYDYAWILPESLRPFAEYKKEFSAKSKGKLFLAAIKEAETPSSWPASVRPAGFESDTADSEADDADSDSGSRQTSSKRQKPSSSSAKASKRSGKPSFTDSRGRDDDDSDGAEPSGGRGVAARGSTSTSKSSRRSLRDTLKPFAKDSPLQKAARSAGSRESDSPSSASREDGDLGATIPRAKRKGEEASLRSSPKRVKVGL
nr:hypothetical protein HK105_001558 [Polyrhizophydium stewartii]